MENVEKVPNHLQDEALVNLTGVDVYDASALEKGKFVSFAVSVCHMFSSLPAFLFKLVGLRYW